MQISTIYSIDDIISNYEKTNSGHFFDKDTMKFFKSRLTTHFKKLDELNYLFITTESNFSNTKRYATLRLATVQPDSQLYYGFKISINTVGNFNQYTIPQARREMERFKLNSQEVA